MLSDAAVFAGPLAPLSVELYVVMEPELFEEEEESPVLFPPGLFAPACPLFVVLLLVLLSLLLVVL
jgi:hypothetical protein